jgi:hypothetical protein
MTRFSQLSQDAVNRHLQKFRETQSWILQELNELDGDDERVEIMIENKIDCMIMCNGPIVMNWGTDNEKDWLLEFADECCWYWNHNEEKFEK